MPAMADALTRLPDRSVLALTGPDTIALLERLVTHNTADWPAGEARYGALLTPQGKVIADYIALRTEDGVLLDVAAGALPDLEKRLKLFRLRADVAVAAADDIAVYVTPSREGSFSDPRCNALPQRLLAAPGLDAPGDPAAYDALRVAHAVPEWGRDFTAAEVFPSDINMDRMSGVDLKKGCFVGQEVVSRMHRRGNIRRRTLALEAAGAAPGDTVEAGAPLGDINSAADGRALARLRIDRLAKALASDQAITVSGAPANLHLPDWLSAEMDAMLADG